MGLLLSSIPVLVTGGTGFIGSHLVRRLLENGAKVHLLVRPKSSTWRISDLKGELQLWEGDIADSRSVAESLAGSRVEIVFHLAGNTQVRRMNTSLNQIDASMEVNLKGALNLIRGIQESGITLRCFVQTGGLEEYGNGPAPYREDQRESPVSFYSASQAAVTHFCQMLHRTLHFPVVILRPALTYGPAQSTDFFIPSLITHCLQGRHFKMTAGDQGRDFIYVGDLVEAYLKATISPQALGEVINIGSGIESKIKDVAETILKLTQKTISLEREEGLTRSSEIHHLYCRNEKAKKLLNWSPQTDLEKGLLQTIAWYWENRDQLQLCESKS